METILCKGFTFIFRDRPTRIGGPGFFIVTPPRPGELRFLLTAGLRVHVAVGGFFPRSRKYCIETDSGVASVDNWEGGGGIFIYSCTQTLKTINLRRN